MNKIDKHEMFQNLRSFLKSKGVTLDEGTYSKRVEQACHVLTGAVNAGQSAVERAKVEVNKTVDNLRQSIHEATAPKRGRAKASSAKKKTARSNAPKE